jgi:hypothetical protein
MDGYRKHYVSMTGLPDLISILRRRFVPELRTRGDSDAAAAIQLLHGHPAEMRDLDGSRRHDSMVQARLARIHQAALARTKSFVGQVTLSADSGLVRAAVDRVA